jgi:hypothetical protein
MKNIVTTGHTSGIGKYLFEYYGGVGLSKSQGFDICKDDITRHVNNETIFFNNAYTLQCSEAQSKMLIETVGICKKIICIGTNTENKGVYRDSKLRLEDLCKKYFEKGYDVTYLALGKVDTPFLENCDHRKISKEYVVECVDFILRSPYRIEKISVRPD